MTTQDQRQLLSIYGSSSLWYFYALFVCAAIPVAVCDMNCQTIYQKTPDGIFDFVLKNETQEYNNFQVVTEDQWQYVPCDINNYCELTWTNGDTGEPIVEDGFVKFENQNQTLIILKARRQEVNYTCNASNGRESLHRSLVLYTINKTLGAFIGVGIPRLPTCRNTTAEKGETVTFICQYIVPHYFVLWTSWKKFNETDNGFYEIDHVNDTYKEQDDVTTWYDESYFYYERDGIPNNGYLIFNTTLFIHDISDEAYGLYQLFVGVNVGQNYGTYELALNPKPVPKKVWNGLLEVVILMCIVLTASVFLLLIYRHKKLQIQLYCKDNWDYQSPDRYLDDVGNDAYISYCHNSVDPTDDDLNFVIYCLKEKLQQRGYKTCVRDINHVPGTSIHEEIVNSLDNSRRCILVISPAYLKSWVAVYDVNIGVDCVKSYWRQIIPIIFKDVSNEPDLANHKLLNHILDDHKCLKWPDTSTRPGSNDKNIDKKKRRFYLELMLRMPPLRQTVSANTDDVQLTSDIEPVSETTPNGAHLATDVPLHEIRNKHSSIYPSCPNDVLY